MKKNAGRPVGARIREVLEITEQMGVSNTTAIRRQMTGFVEFSNVCKFCSRAVGLGLLKADRTTKPITYTVVSDWRQQIDARPAERIRPPQPKAPPPVNTWKQANSVFALGAA